MKTNPIDIQEISRWLRIDASSPSGLIWIKQRHHRAPKAGAFAGCNSSGYWSVMVYNKHYMCSRIIMALTTGEDRPDLEVDHIDRNPLNNSVDNLRWLDRRGQNLNRKPMGRSKVKHVHWHRDRWRVQHWKLGFIGYYSTLEEATRVAKQHFGDCS